MNKNFKKGFAIPIIIAVTALLAVGGGAYIYTNNKVVEAPIGIPDIIGNMPTTTVDNNVIASTTPTTPISTKPSITVLYPNGKEVWISGQSQTIKWKYSSLPDLEQGGKKYPVVLNIGLLYQDVSVEKPDQYGAGRLCVLANDIPVSNGSFTFIPKIGDCPKINSSRPFIKDGNYRIVVYVNYKGLDGDSIANDESDNDFTISSSLVACTMDAKQCPDGSYVGRSGPNCEFVCPEVKVEKATGIIKSVYTQSGENYIDIDYITLNSNWKPGGMSGSAYTNENTQIRTFRISSDAKFIIGSPATNLITFKEFGNLFISTGSVNGVNQYTYQKSNPWSIVITNNVVTQISEYFLP